LIYEVVWMKMLVFVFGNTFLRPWSSRGFKYLGGGYAESN